MLVAHVYFSVAVNDRAAALEALLAEVGPVRSMAGCLRFIPFADPTDETRLGVVHEWEDATDFAHYLESNAFKDLGETLRPMMKAPPLSRRFDATLQAA